MNRTGASYVIAGYFISIQYLHLNSITCCCVSCCFMSRRTKRKFARDRRETSCHETQQKEKKLGTYQMMVYVRRRRRETGIKRRQSSMMGEWCQQMSHKETYAHIFSTHLSTCQLKEDQIRLLGNHYTPIRRDHKQIMLLTKYKQPNPLHLLPSVRDTRLTPHLSHLTIT